MHPEHTNDLELLLSRARGAVGGDGQRVLPLPAFGYDSSLEEAQALVLGGAPSPRFLRRVPDEGTLYADRVPLTFAVSAVRLLLVESFEGGVGAWAPLLGELVKAHQGLLVVAGEVSGENEAVQTLLVNTERNVLRTGIALLPGGSGSLADLAERIAAGTGTSARAFHLPRGATPQGLAASALPQADRAYLRKDSCLVLPPAGTAWSGLTQTIAVIRVGGEDLEDQQARLEFAVRHLRSAY